MTPTMTPITCFIYRSDKVYECEPPRDLIYSGTEIPLEVAVPWYPPKTIEKTKCFLCFSPHLQEIYLRVQSDKEILLMQSYMDLRQVFAKCKIKIGEGLLDFLTTYAQIGILICPDIAGQEKVTLTNKHRIMSGVNFACPVKVLNKLFLKDLDSKTKKIIQKTLQDDTSAISLFLQDAIKNKTEEISKVLFFNTNWLASLPKRKKKILQDIVFTNRGIAWKV